MFPFLAVAAIVIFGLFLWYQDRSRRSITHLPGPPSDSWLVGNIPSFQRVENVGDSEFRWSKQYGNAFRIKGCFGENVLYLTDPKALQYVLNSYNFPKSWEVRIGVRLVTGPGVAMVEGAQHARQRKIMNQAFSHSAMKGLLPLFVDLSRKTTATWKTLIRKQNTDTSVLDVASLLTLTTLDAIGEAAFGYKFNSIEGVKPKTELHKAYENLFFDANYMISDVTIIYRRLLGYAPLWLSDMLTSLPISDMKRLTNYMSIARSVAKDLLEKQRHVRGSGKEGGKDVMSIFIKANNAEDPKRRLESEEVIPQITTLMLAGHDTTANFLSWMLYELSKHPKVQFKLREELKATRANVASRGDFEITTSDMDSMTYMIAVMKETLRYHPILTEVFRRADQDDVIPLDMPQRTLLGDTISAIPVRKGQVLHLGMSSYNRLKEVWGEDADHWRPERFLHELPNQRTVGLYGNLSTFGSGPHGCIGWRFALIQAQTVLIELIENFDFSPAPDVHIKRAISTIMQSMVQGQENKGKQLPLRVSIVSK